MKYMDWLRKATDDAVSAIKWPSQRARIDRAFADREDDLLETEAKVQEQIIEIERRMVTAPKEELRSLIDQGLELLADLEAAKLNTKNAAEWYNKLKGDGPAEA
jgi:hypothetical protein